MVHVLKPYQHTTEVFCAHIPSLGQVIPLIRELDWALSSAVQLGLEGMPVLQQVKALAGRLWVDIATRLHPLCDEQEYKLAYMFDPWIKGSIAACNMKLMEWKRELHREV